MKTAKSSAPMTANMTVRRTLPLTSPAMYEENWKPMNWKSTTLTRPARPINPRNEKSGEPMAKFDLVAVAIKSDADLTPSAGNAALTWLGEMKNAPKKLIATETIAKMVRPVTTLWKVRGRRMGMPKMTSRIIAPTMALLVLSCSQLGALEKALPGKATPSRMAVN